MTRTTWRHGFQGGGTAKGITAIQLDIKAEGLAHDILVEALQQAKEARLKILDIMSRVIDKPRSAEHLCRIVTIKIDPEYIAR